MKQITKDEPKIGQEVWLILEGGKKVRVERKEEMFGQDEWYHPALGYLDPIAWEPI
jgi:hypothetical protein